MAPVILSFEMDTRQDYKGCGIEANPRELADGSGWTQDYNIEIHYEDRTEVRPSFSDRKFSTTAEAIAGCISAGKRTIDRSPLLRSNPVVTFDTSKVDEQDARQGETPSWKDAELPEDLKATWRGDENLHPVGVDGDKALRFEKGKRARRLDELDSEPE